MNEKNDKLEKQTRPLNAGINPSNSKEKDDERKVDEHTSSFGPSEGGGDDGVNRPSRDRDINPGAVRGPLVVLVGPGNSGKTVALISLLRYLKKSGKAAHRYNQGFIGDSYYNDAVNKFDAALKDSKYNPDRTEAVNYLLLDVSKKGKYFCQVLEAPGEHYFNADNPDHDEFEPYQYELLFSSSFPKIYVFFFEEDMLKGQVDSKYGIRLAQIASHLNSNHNDRVILLYNKVDQVARTHGTFDPDSLKNEILKNVNYKGMVEQIKKTKARLLFVPYSGGYFNKANEVGTKSGLQENLRWTPPNDDYPENLWKHIETAILNEDRSWWPW